MSASAPPVSSEARTRLLGTASGIFYAKGINAVGVDEIVEAARVTRSTLYRHFGSKDGLVVAYLDAASAMERAAVEGALAQVRDGGAPAGKVGGAIGALAGAVVAQIHDPAFRGCAFLNATAEFPDPSHPIHQAVLRHRAWYADQVSQALDSDADAATLFVLLRDGAMAAGCLADPDAVTSAFLKGVAGLVSPSR
ncbi:TetR/AcrR family transcriptional regulator [Nocardioides KLBMP 9356]|uniref:TetR/AcrR family transcriptional regulator n=1 Tax=Nocardioides potassii TaxID=2911371 RepID=A0ABS9H5Z4_9ACTN|nr:TetR/AcrR family transcriptional regulator [Nocardioides potassii]MCF6376667.1 TetR/AcrR family transcriptional regulator [Nocardioides potassii]